MHKIVRRFSDRITSHHVDNAGSDTSPVRRSPSFLRSLSLRRRSKTKSQILSDQNNFIDPGHPPTPSSQVSSDTNTSPNSRSSLKPPGLPTGSIKRTTKTFRGNGTTENMKYTDPIDIRSDCYGSEHRVHYRSRTSLGTGSNSNRSSGYRLSTELSQDKELTAAIEKSFKTNGCYSDVNTNLKSSLSDALPSYALDRVSCL